MAKITINNKEYEVEDGKTIIQICDENGIEIPRFCYHDKLNIAGNCRMCLVEIANIPKPVASCAMQASDGMIISTNSQMVKKAREGVMEFLLINHPLDCPICDQGGECDLQDQAMAYGKGKNRFQEEKRAVEDKYFGPLIKTHMTRCIQCTRCIRFSDEIAGTSELGAISRGEDMEVISYLNKTVTSELSGNLIDLCPVGALTSKPYAFKARSWELKKTYSIDVHDAVGSNIRIDSRGLEVLRILPSQNDEINEEWISDKTRFSYDGLKNQRIGKPYIRKNNRFESVSWEEAFKKIADIYKKALPQEIAAIGGDLSDCETMLVMKDILQSKGSFNMDVLNEEIAFDISNRASYIFNSSILGIEKSDLCLIIGANPRHEATMVNARIRKRYMQGKYPVYGIGCASNQTYEIKDLGDNPAVLEEILVGKSEICKELKKAKNPMMIIGYGAISGKGGKKVLANLAQIAEKYGFITKDWNNFNILHRTASIVGALDIGFIPQNGGGNTKKILEEYQKGNIKLLFILANDNVNPSDLKGEGAIVYIGHHGDNTANYADIILPGAAYTEKDGTYVNLEGRAQRCYRAVQPPGQARADWQILIDLSNYLNIKLEYDNLDKLREKMVKISPVFGNLNNVNKEKWKEINAHGEITQKNIKPLDINYYLSNSICRASQTMANCVKEIVNNK